MFVETKLAKSDKQMIGHLLMGNNPVDLCCVFIDFMREQGCYELFKKQIFHEIESDPEYLTDCLEAFNSPEITSIIAG